MCVSGRAGACRGTTSFFQLCSICLSLCWDIYVHIHYRDEQCKHAKHTLRECTHHRRRQARGLAETADTSLYASKVQWLLTSHWRGCRLHRWITHVCSILPARRIARMVRKRRVAHVRCTPYSPRHRPQLSETQPAPQEHHHAFQTRHEALLLAHDL